MLDAESKLGAVVELDLENTHYELILKWETNVRCKSGSFWLWNQESKKGYKSAKGTFWLDFLQN